MHGLVTLRICVQSFENKENKTILNIIWMLCMFYFVLFCLKKKKYNDNSKFKDYVTVVKRVVVLSAIEMCSCILFTYLFVFFHFFVFNLLITRIATVCAHGLESTAVFSSVLVCACRFVCFWIDMFLKWIAIFVILCTCTCFFVRINCNYC